MLICRTSPFSGTYNRLEIDMDVNEYRDALKRWMTGTPIQQAFPTLAPEIREFIATGITPSEWDAMFSDEEE